MIKEKRNLSGVYFRFKNTETNEMENRTFEDLPEDDQKKMLEGRTREWVESLALVLAKTLREIGDEFDIIVE